MTLLKLPYLSVLPAAAVALLLCGTSAQAQVIDAAGDFLPTYTGVRGGDLDVLSTNVTYTGSSFIITATLNGNVGTTPGALFVWGFDRGAGTARFSPALANTENVLFDSVVTLRPDTTATINRIVGGGATNLGAGTVTINGATLTATINASELPSLGLLRPDQYTYNLWPRLGTGNNNQISDFAPNNANAQVNSAPEPTSAALAALALPLAFGMARTRRKRCGYKSN